MIFNSELDRYLSVIFLYTNKRPFEVLVGIVV